MSAGELRVRIRGLDAAGRRALSRGDWTLVEADEPCDLELAVAGARASMDGAAASGDGTDSPTGGTGRGDRTRSHGAAEASAGTTPATVDLTPREQEVLVWLGRGASNADIGHHLFITENTVKNHVRNILRKLECGSRTKAVVTAHQMGLLDL